MVYDRIVDNKELGRTIWNICTAFSNDLCSVERFALRWIICNTLNDLYYVEWFVLRWMIFDFLAKPVRPRKICTALTDLYYVEWFGVRWMICTTLNYLGYDKFIGLLMSDRYAYSKKHCKIFYTNLWVDFFLTWKYQEIFLALPQEWVIKKCFWSL